MKYKVFFCIAVLLSASAMASAITGEQVLMLVDANMAYASGRFESEMIIHVGDEVRTKKMVSYAEGKNKSFAEFTYPARDAGVKYLKLDDNMWMYLPSVDKVIKIAGHMLRQSMMGSDFSYEDALESANLLEKYDAALVTEEVVSIDFQKDGEKMTKQRPCFVLELTAKVKEVAYYQRKLWVDKEVFLPVKEELYAMSGKKLKIMMLGDVKKFGKRYYPMYVSLQNLLRQDSLTEMIVTKANFNIKIPEDTFSQRNLKQ